MPQPFEPTRSDRKTVYANSPCRRIFRQFDYSKLRKSKVIRAVVRTHNLSVWLLSEDQLVATLRCLLEDGVFESDSVAQSRFPELFKFPQVESPAAESFSDNLSQSFAYIPMDLQKSIQADSLKRNTRLFETGHYSDLIVLGGKEYRVHQNIICEHSAALAAASKATWQVWGPAAASSTQTPNAALVNNMKLDPTATRKFLPTHNSLAIDLQAENPNAVDCMMQFCYKQNYDPRAFDDASSDVPVLFIHVASHKLGEVYGLDHLKSLSLAKFEHEAKSSVVASDFARASGEAFADSHPTLSAMQDAVLKCFLRHRKQLIPDENMRKLFHSDGRLAYVFLSYLNTHS